MDVKDINFKEYLANKKKMDEELEMQQRSEAEQSYQTQAMNGSVESLLTKYVGRGDLKEGLKNLGADLGKAIFDYAINTYVTDDMFASADDRAKYNNIIAQKIQQTAASTLVDLLKHMSIDIANTKNAITM